MRPIALVQALDVEAALDLDIQGLGLRFQPTVPSLISMGGCAVWWLIVEANGERLGSHLRRHARYLVGDLVVARSTGEH